MEKQNEILKYLQTVESANIEQIYTNVNFGYYHNRHKHMGNILSRMVTDGRIKRLKKGVYCFVSLHIKQKDNPIVESNLKLF